MKKSLIALTVVSALVLPVVSNAALDLTAVETGFGDLTTAITTVGGLILSAAVVAVAFKWIKGMIFS